MAKTQSTPAPGNPTYSDGRPVQLRDLAAGTDHTGAEVFGVVVGCNPDGEQGTIELQYLAPGGERDYPLLKVQTFDAAGKSGLTPCTIARAFGDAAKFRKLS